MKLLSDYEYISSDNFVLISKGQNIVHLKYYTYNQVNSTVFCLSASIIYISICACKLTSTALIHFNFKYRFCIVVQSFFFRLVYIRR